MSLGTAVGGSLPQAVGVALSPVPIIAVVLMLTTRRARGNGLAFVVGWLAGLAAVGAIVLCVFGPAGASSSGSPATWVSWLKLVLGLLLLLVAVREFRARPKQSGGRVALPKWMGKIDTMRPPAALGLAAALAGANPKNLMLAISGAATIAATGISGAQQAVAYAIFAAVGTVGVAIPVAIYFAGGPKSEKTLARLKDWMGEHNAVIMSVLCLIIGVNLIGGAIGALSG
jgi:hypothetical protein